MVFISYKFFYLKHFKKFKRMSNFKTRYNRWMSKETGKLDELLKLIGREAYFKQFVHPSLKTEFD
jgi:hypothetical protein